MLVTDQAKLIRLPINFRHLVEGGFENHEGFSIIGRGSSGVRVFNVSKGEKIVGAARIDEDESPENEAEEAVVEEMLERRGGGDETQPEPTLDRDDNIESDEEE
jgi:DNA gyrase subunit A